MTCTESSMQKPQTPPLPYERVCRAVIWPFRAVTITSTGRKQKHRPAPLARFVASFVVLIGSQFPVMLRVIVGNYQLLWRLQGVLFMDTRSTQPYRCCWYVRIVTNRWQYDPRLKKDCWYNFVGAFVDLTKWCSPRRMVHAAWERSIIPLGILT